MHKIFLVFILTVLCAGIIQGQTAQDELPAESGEVNHVLEDLKNQLRERQRVFNEASEQERKIEQDARDTNRKAILNIAAIVVIVVGLVLIVVGISLSIKSKKKPTPASEESPNV